MSTPPGLFGPSGGYWIDEDEVRKAGSAAIDVAKAIPDDIKVLYRPSDAAVAGLTDWQSAKALDDCLEAWVKALRSLSGMIETAGEKVIESAKGYKAEDHRQAGALQFSLPRSPDFGYRNGGQ
ncbi:hypothetical protein ACR820_14130 [Streptomyces netropsis]